MRPVWNSLSKSYMAVSALSCGMGLMLRDETGMLENISMSTSSFTSSRPMTASLHNAHSSDFWTAINHDTQGVVQRQARTKVIRESSLVTGLYQVCTYSSMALACLKSAVCILKYGNIAPSVYRVYVLQHL